MKHRMSCLWRLLLGKPVCYRCHFVITGELDLLPPGYFAENHFEWREP
jgi:hypothetical protein